MPRKSTPVAEVVTTPTTVYQIRSSTIIIVYIAIVCIALLSNTAVFVHRMHTSTIEGAKAISTNSVLRAVESLQFSIASLEANAEHLAASIESSGESARNYSTRAPIADLEASWRSLLPSSAIRSVISQEEVWYSEKERRFINTGCLHGDSNCFRSDGQETSYVPFFNRLSLFEFQALSIVPLASPHYHLHEKMLRQPIYHRSEGVWTPTITQLTQRSTALQCGNQSVENILAYYRCIELADDDGDSAAVPTCGDDGGATGEPLHHFRNKEGRRSCLHAVVTIFELQSLYSLQGYGMSPSSLVTIHSQRNINHLENASCTAAQAATTSFATQQLFHEHPAILSSSSGLWTTTQMDKSANISAVAAYKTSSGIFFIFAESIPASFFTGPMETDRNIGVAISLVVAAFVVAVGLLSWHRITIPLQQVCYSMKRLAKGFLDDTEDELDGYSTPVPSTFKYISGNTQVLEIFELYDAYKDLYHAMGELKAFAPQGLMVADMMVQDVDVINRLSDSSTTRECDGNSSSRSNQNIESGLKDNGAVLSAAAAASSSSQAKATPHLTVANPTSLSRRASPVERPRVVFPHAASVSTLTSLPPQHLHSNASSGIGGDGDEKAIRDAPSPELPQTVGLRSTSFRTVSCSTLHISFRYAYADTERMEADVQQRMETCIGIILVCGGTIEIFRPELLSVSFGAQTADTLHTKHALLCAMKVFKSLDATQRPHVQLLVDTGHYHVGTCGAHNRYSRFISGERMDFALRFRNYELGWGRVATTDNVAQASFSKRYSFAPLDNVVPRGGIAGHKSTILLFHVVLNEDMTADQKVALQALHSCYLDSINGNFERAAERLKNAPIFEEGLQASLLAAMQTLSETKPRRPRFCRFELPPFETLGYNVAPHVPVKMHKPLVLDTLDSSVPSVDFLFGDTELGGEENDMSSVGPLTSAGSMSLKQLSKPNMSVNASMKVDGNFSTTKGVVEMNDDLPVAFIDSKGETWVVIPTPIGSGAFASVYKGISMNGSLVALKCVRLSMNNVHFEDIVKEVNTACQLLSEHIVNYTSWAHVGNFLVVVMEYMPGGSLFDITRHFPKGLCESVVKRYSCDTLNGLAYLHRNGIVHADLKPQNILLSSDGGCRISDFGSIVTKSDAATSSGDVAFLRGTPLYMSPEVVRGEAPTMKSDVWSFGITLYELLTGQLPWVWLESKKPIRFSHHDAGIDPATTTSRDPLKVRSTAALTVRPMPPRAGFKTYRLPPIRDPELSQTIQSRQTLRDMEVPPNFFDELLTSKTDGVISLPLFLQGIAKGHIGVHVDRSLLPMSEVGEIIETCLEMNADRRPSVNDLLFLHYFYK